MSAATGLVYLDFAATTPLDAEVAAAMLAVQGEAGDFANPSAVHPAGRRSAMHVRQAAAALAALLNTSPRQIIWTSGATESNNLAIQGVARQRAHRGKHLISMPTEHKAVSDVLRALARQGYDISWLQPGSNGQLDLDELRATLRDDTQLVSIMHVNNETGVVQDIAAIGEICRQHEVLFHVDAAQSFGKLPLDLNALPIDLMSVTAHKLYGPKGIGALYVAGQRNAHIEPLLFGGGQQRRLRPGTLAVPLIVGFGRAATIAGSRMAADLAHLKQLQQQLWEGISDLPGLRLNGDLKRGFPGLLNVSVADVEGESLLLALEPLCVATGSACNSANQEPSSVLRAMGRSDSEAQGAIRFSLGRSTTSAEIDFAIAQYRAAVTRLRALAPEAA